MKNFLMVFFAVFFAVNYIFPSEVLAEKKVTSLFKKKTVSQTRTPLSCEWKNKKLVCTGTENEQKTPSPRTKIKEVFIIMPTEQENPSVQVLIKSQITNSDLIPRGKGVRAAQYWSNK